MFTIYDLRDIIQTVFWGGVVVVLLIGWGVMAACKAKWWLYATWLVIVPAGFLALILPSPKEYKAAKEYRQRYETAKAIFEQQCQNAGEKIYRTVDNVEGIMLLKVVPKSNYSSADAQARDPMWDNAALRTYDGDGFIWQFLALYREVGYKYIDVLQENKRDIIRYTDTDYRPPPIQIVNPKQPSRYAVTFEYNLDPELRKHWIAGATIQIIDLHTNEMMAEKIIYVFEKGLGGQGGGRMPWHFAVDCPNQEFSRRHPITHFVTKVIQPKKQEIQNTKN